MTEQSLERIEIEHTCTQLSIAYARHIDFREYDAFVELFAEDAHLNAGYPFDGKVVSDDDDDVGLCTNTRLTPLPRSSVTSGSAVTSSRFESVALRAGCERGFGREMSSIVQDLDLHEPFGHFEWGGSYWGFYSNAARAVRPPSPASAHPEWS